MEAQDDYFVNLFTPLYKTLPTKAVCNISPIYTKNMKWMSKVLECSLGACTTYSVLVALS